MAGYRRRGNRFGDPEGPATEKTKEFLSDLLRDKDLGDQPELRTMIERQIDNGLKQGLASKYIALLKELPGIPRDDEPTQTGYYLHDGTIYKVQQARAGHLYALKRDEEGRFKELARGVFYRLTANELMSSRQVKAAGL